MNPTLKAQFEAILKEEYAKISGYNSHDSILLSMQRAYDLRQSEIDAIQAKITRLSGLLLDAETKFDVIAEKEAERMVEFGNEVKKEAVHNSHCTIDPFEIMESIRGINIKQLYTNFKRKDNGKND